MPNAQMKKMKNEERWKERIEGATLNAMTGICGDMFSKCRSGYCL